MTLAEAGTETKGSRTRGENAEYVISQIRALGHEPNQTSRFMQMYSLVQHGGPIPFDDPRFPVALESVKDIQQLGFIFEQFADVTERKKLNSHIRTLLKDSALPQSDREKSFGRDKQFELYLAAVCLKAGFKDVVYDEPDITCEFEGRTFSIAAKRVKHVDRVRNHIRKAAKQIAKRGHPGIIAVDLSVAFNRTNRPEVAVLNEEFLDFISQERVRQPLVKLQDTIFEAARAKHVLGVVVFYFEHRERNRQWTINGRTVWFPLPEEGPEDMRTLERFSQAFTDGVPGMQKDEVNEASVGALESPPVTPA